MGPTRLNKPWLHFLVLGAVFYALQGALFPEPRTVIGPLSDARIDALQERWFASTGRHPSPEQTARLISLELDRDLLLQRALELDFHLHDTVVYQRLIRNMRFLQLAEGKSDAQLFEQALQMRLHLDDQVVNQRLIQLMEQQLLAERPLPEPSAEQINAEFEKRVEELRVPPRYSIEHLFFNRETESDALAAIAVIKEQRLDFQGARHLGSPFIQGHHFVRETPGQLARIFGREFVLSLEQARPEARQWLGPIRSSYGLHYLWISALEPSREARLADVEQQLRRDLEYALKAQALRDAIAALRDVYDVRGAGFTDPDVAAIESTATVTR